MNAEIIRTPEVWLVTTENEFTEAVRERRHALGLSHLEVDDIAGMQQGYTGKLENAGKPWAKRAINASCWWLLGALKLVMVLIPASQAIRSDRCPCCGSPSSPIADRCSTSPKRAA